LIFPRTNVLIRKPLTSSGAAAKFLQRSMKWIPYGPNGLLFQFAPCLGDEAFERGRAIASELEQHPPPGLLEFVPAFMTVLLEFDPHEVPDAKAIAAEVAERLERAASVQLPPAAVKEIPIRYDGPDLDRVAQCHQLSVQEVCEIHSAPIYKVYMLGFSPGFPYLGDLDRRLHTPRLTSPRTRIEAGSIGIGGEHTGIYSVASPGGWNIIGKTSAKVFDPARGESVRNDEAMFLLRQGDRVKFVSVAKL
jgi:inhibitor of KinA